MDVNKGISRRSFFKTAAVVAGGGAALSLLVGKPLASRFLRKKQFAEFPDDSIFAPAKKRRI